MKSSTAPRSGRPFLCRAFFILLTVMTVWVILFIYPRHSSSWYPYPPMRLGQIRRLVETSKDIAMAVPELKVLKTELMTTQGKTVHIPITTSIPNISASAIRGKGKCKSILLLVLFNYAYYDNIPLLRSMYGRLAGKMVFYGPEEDKARGVRRSVDQLHGFLQHQSIAQAWRDNPGFDGMLWMADDMFVNLPLLFGDPKFSWDRIWLWNRTSPLIKDCEAHPIVVNLNHIPNIWHFGHPYANDNVHHADTLVANWRKDLPQRYTKRQMHLFGEERIHAHGSDFGYIPKPLMPEFLAVVDIKSLRNLEFELFVPTFLRLLSDNPDDVVSWNGRYFWVPHVCPHWSKAFDCNRDHTMHPLKLSSQEHRAQIAGLPCNPERVSTADIQRALDC
eukprot:scpid81542/ scgid16075/ 